MKRSSYRERDYSFGQTMLTVRTRIGLTQAVLGTLISAARLEEQALARQRSRKDSPALAYYEMERSKAGRGKGIQH